MSMYRGRLLVFVVLTALGAMSSQAAIYKCRTHNGPTIFSDRPCRTLTVEESNIKAPGKGSTSAGGAPRLRALKRAKASAHSRTQSQLSPPEFADSQADFAAVQAAARDAGIHVVEYRVVGGQDELMITFKNRWGAQERRSVAVPWRYYFPAGEGVEVSLSTQNESDRPVTVHILLDGVPVIQESSSASTSRLFISGRI